MSLTEVLPTEPVIPTTRAPSARRQARASACSAASGSSTAKTQPAVEVACELAPARDRLDRRRPRRPPRSPPRRTRRRRRARRAGRRRGRPARPRASRSPPAAASPARPRRRPRRPIAAAISSGVELHAGAAQLPQLLAGDLAVVEGDLAAVLELLALLVALAGDHDRVARPARAQRQRDRRAPVGLDLDARRRRSIPARISAMIASGSSERGLSEVTIARSDSSRPGPAHLRPLVAVAVAAGAEDRDQPALGQPPRGAAARSRASPGCGRSRRGPRTSWPSSIGSKRPGHPRRPRPAPRRRSPASTPSAVAAAKAPSALATLKWPGSAVRTAISPSRPGDGEARPAGVEGDVAGAEVGLRALGREGDAVEFLGEAAAVGVVDVDDRDPRPHLEEQPLGEEVVLHVGVEVEVVLGQVGEERDLEVDRVGRGAGRARARRPPSRRPGRRPRASAGRSPAGRSPPAWSARPPPRPPPTTCFTVPSSPHCDRRRLEDLAQQEGGRRLAVGPGDPDHPQLGRRVAPEARRQRRHRRPRVRRPPPAARPARARARPPAPPRPASTARGGELVPVGLLARHAEEQRPRPDLAGCRRRGRRSRRRGRRDSPRAVSPPRSARPVSRGDSRSCESPPAGAPIPAGRRDRAGRRRRSRRRRAPRPSRRRFRPCGSSTITATSSCGSWAGAKPMNEATYLVSE